MADWCGPLFFLLLNLFRRWRIALKSLAEILVRFFPVFVYLYDFPPQVQPPRQIFILRVDQIQPSMPSRVLEALMVSYRNPQYVPR